MRAYALNSDNYPLRTEKNGKKKNPILHVCSMDGSKSKEFLADKNLFQVCSTDKGKPESIIVDEISTEESESECFHKSINK